MLPSPSHETLPYIPSLNGLRGIAILMVMLWHYDLIGFGWTGVSLFFVLSGYLITRILVQEKANSTSTWQQLKYFWMRRVLRIFPAYYLYLIILLVIYLLTQRPQAMAGQFGYLFTYTFNFTRLNGQWSYHPFITHLWSLSVEEQFYLFYPFLVILLPERPMKITAVVIILSAVLLRYLLGTWLSAQGKSDLETGDTIYWTTFSHLDAFLLGGSIVFFRLDQWLLRYRKWLFGSILFITLLAGGINFWLTGSKTFIHYIQSLGFEIDQTRYQFHIWFYTLMNSCFAALLLLLLPGNGGAGSMAARLFSNRILMAVGKVSYGMYLYHWAVMHLLFLLLEHLQIIVHPWVLILPYILLVYLLSWFSYTCYEKKFLRLKDAFR
jgi:peptidoglycan/LPS O-acetylase OafA/YrhL